MVVVHTMLCLKPSLITTAACVCRKWRDVVRRLCRTHRAPSPVLLQRMLMGAPLVVYPEDEIQRLLVCGQQLTLVWLLPRLPYAERPAWLRAPAHWVTRSLEGHDAMHMDAGPDLDFRAWTRARAKHEQVYAHRERIATAILHENMVSLAETLLRDTMYACWLFPLLCCASEPDMREVVLDAALTQVSPGAHGQWAPAEEALLAAAQAGNPALLSALFERGLCTSAHILQHSQALRLLSAAARNVQILQVLLHNQAATDRRHTVQHMRYMVQRSDADDQVSRLLEEQFPMMAAESLPEYCNVELVTEANQYLFRNYWGGQQMRLADASAMARNRDAFVRRFAVRAVHQSEHPYDVWETVHLPKQCKDHLECYLDKWNNLVLVASPYRHVVLDADLDGFEVAPPMYSPRAWTLVRVLTRDPAQMLCLPVPQSELVYNTVDGECSLSEMKAVVEAFEDDGRSRHCDWFKKLAEGAALQVIEVRYHDKIVAYMVIDHHKDPRSLSLVFTMGAPCRVAQFMALVRMLLYDISAMHTVNTCTPCLIVTAASDLESLLLGCGWRACQSQCVSTDWTMFAGPAVLDIVRARALRDAVVGKAVEVLPVVRDMAYFSTTVWDFIREGDLAALKDLLLGQLLRTNVRAHDKAIVVRNAASVAALAFEDINVEDYW